MRPALLRNISLDLYNRRFRSAVAGAARLVTAHPDDPVALYWLGESYRSLGPRQPELIERELTDGGLRKGYRRTRKLTEEEDTQALAATPDGHLALEANRRKAEEMLLKSASIDPTRADTHFALGALYEQQGKLDAATAAYGKCIDLGGQSAAKARAKRRLEELASRPSVPGKESK
jgi:tetratricopeptide (TPR) repeat protein